MGFDRICGIYLSCPTTRPVKNAGLDAVYAMTGVWKISVERTGYLKSYAAEFACWVWCSDRKGVQTPIELALAETDAVGLGMAGKRTGQRWAEQDVELAAWIQIGAGDDGQGYFGE